MKTIRFLLLLSPFLLAAQCEVSYSTANIQHLRVCDQLNTADQCDEHATSFLPNAPMFIASCDLENAPDDTPIAFYWYYLGEERLLIDSVVFTSQTGNSLKLHSTLNAPHNGWPEGQYEVTAKVLTDNGNSLSQSFEVSSPISANPAADISYTDEIPIDESAIFEATRSFFQWYAAHHYPLSQIDIIRRPDPTDRSDKGGLDQEGLADYLTYWQSCPYVSEDFIAYETAWLKKAEAIWQETEEFHDPDYIPYGMDHDRILNTQETDYVLDQAINGPIHLAEVQGPSAFVEAGGVRLGLIYEGGRWQVLTFPYMW